MDHLHVASQRSRLAIAVSTVVALIAALILVVSPSRSLAAEPPGDQIYWGNESGAVRSGNLDGSGHRRGRVRRRDAVRGGDRPCGTARSTGPTGPAARSGSGTSTASAAPRPCSRPRAGTSAGWRSILRHGKIYWANFSADTIRVGNLDGVGARPWTLFTRARGRRAARAGWRSTPRPARSTGPTSSPTRSGSGTWTARVPPRPCSAATLPSYRRAQPDRGGDRPRGRQDLLDQPRQLLQRSRSGPGREPGRQSAQTAPDPVHQREPARAGWRSTPGEQDLLGHLRRPALDPVREPGRHAGTASTLFSGESSSLFAALLKTPAGTAVSGDLRSRRGSHLQPGGMGVRPARGVPVPGPAELRVSVADRRRRDRRRNRSRPSRPPSPVPTPAR